MPATPFIGQTYQHRSRHVSAQRTLNLYPELISVPGAVSEYILIGTPGTETFADLSSVTADPCRGLHYTSLGVLYGVYGDKLVRVKGDGTIDASFTMSGGRASQVYFADNGKWLVITDGEEMWLLDTETDAFTTQNLLPFDQPVQVKYIGSRFVSFGKDSNQYWWSDVGPDGVLNWSGLSFASAEGSADLIVAIAVTDGELVLFGDRSYEVHRITSDEFAPFARVNGSFSHIGCGAPNSVAEILGNVYWLGSSTAGKNQVFMLQGYNAVPISNHAISFMLGELDKSAPNDLVNTTSDAIGFTYQQEGHVFYVLTLVQANKTLVYDTNGQWHERSTRDPTYNLENKYEPLHCVYAYQRIITGNGSVPKMLTLELDRYKEYDDRAIKRQRVGPTGWDDQGYIYYNDFIIDVEPGVGLTDNALQGHDPQIMLRFSDDSGQTWSNEKWTTMGKVGKYNTRARWRYLGKGYKRVYEVTVTDPVKVVMLSASMTGMKSKNR